MGELVQVIFVAPGWASPISRFTHRFATLTCSLLRQENEDIAVAFSAVHGDFESLPADHALAELKVDQAMSLCHEGLNGAVHLRLWPHRHGTDGFFAAIWQKK